MSEHKYTDEEVIKALECCSSAECERCAWEPSEDCYKGSLGCNDDLMRSALDLINRQKAEISALTSDVDNSTQEFLKLHDKYQEQKAEIERLIKAIEVQEIMLENHDRKIKATKAEAIKEFAEKLKKELTTGSAIMRVSTLDIINDLVKELTEEKP